MRRPGKHPSRAARLGTPASPLWSVATCRDDDSLESTGGLGRQAAEGQSGDRSPHSRELTLTKPALVHSLPCGHHFGLKLFGKGAAPNVFQLANVSGNSLFVLNGYSKPVATDVAD